MIKNYRIIIDTNLWISFLITNKYSQLDFLLLSKKCTLVFSRDLMNEFLDVASRPKISKYFSANDLEKLLKTINEYAVFIEVNSKIEFLKDAKDDFLLSLSVDGNVDYLITGDKELIAVGQYGKTVITNFTDFLEKILID